jgi:glycosyltransferase involved in cell wall biosynthesis
MFVISCSLDYSLALAKRQGTFQAHRERYQVFCNFDQVVLLTQDIQGFNNELEGLVHVPCAYSRFEIIRSLVSRFKFLRWIYVYFSSFVWLLKNHTKIDLILSENVDSPIPFVIFRLFGIPYFIHYHYDVSTQVSKINRQEFEGVFLLFLEKFCFKRATYVWVTSANLAEKVKSYGAKNVSLIPNWIDFSVNPKNLLENSLKYSKRVLFVGRLHPVKRVGLLLEAFAQLRKVRPATILIIVGDGDERKNLVALANKLDLGVSVQFLGFQIHEKVLDIMRSADLFVLPSEMEGNPRVIMEAMILKVPVVATNVPGIKDMVKHGETGHLVMRPLPEDLAQAMEFVLGHNDYAFRIMENAYTYTQKSFSKESVLKTMRADLVSKVPCYKERFLSKTE